MASSLAVGERAKVAFITALDDPQVDEARSGKNEPNRELVSFRSSVRAVPAWVTATNLREAKGSSRRNSCCDHDIEDSVEVDLIGFQPLPSSIKLSKITERVRVASLPPISYEYNVFSFFVHH